MDRFLRFLANLFEVFFGNARRTQWTLTTCLALWAVTHPSLIAGWIAGLLSAILTAIAPLVPTILTLAIMIFGASLIFRNVFGRGRQRH